MDKTFLIFASIFGGLGVAIGAFGAHGLQGMVTPERLGTFETGVRYMVYHALALLGVAAMLHANPSPLLQWSGWLFIAGIVIFSGSLFLLVLLDKGWLGAITPIGGVAFVAGWLLMLIAALRS